VTVSVIGDVFAQSQTIAAIAAMRLTERAGGVVTRTALEGLLRRRRRRQPR